MAANQVGLPCPPAAPGSVGQSCPAGWVLPGALLYRSPQSEPAPVLVSCQRAGAGQAALLWALPPAARTLPPCVPASTGFGWWQPVAAAWHVVLSPCSLGRLQQCAYILP